ncbi:MAG TPA: glycosyltransferase [Geminicoccus sp.]|jgi:glycosyltransferase involved in cell wall biosynthesis|uniref:glycosyltransferase family protein n=1 Tax=Geminicoccus sp. TaxID=2024832 RepID=UPI002E323C86|nr:glycosyltransferase [Geminicoccus sp.]HEX2525889.1 glycosyltransferase [Geminicoccus sp.]
MAVAASGRKPRIVHLTSVHHAFDNRIFEKECVSLAEAGFDISLVVPDAGTDRVAKGVKILTVPLPRGRKERFLKTTRAVIARGLAEDADVYQFHDPELILPALRLRAAGKPVVFDVHEDYYTSILDKTPYLPGAVSKKVAAWGYYGVERLTRRAFRTVIAERYYARRFPEAVPVLNYPRLEQFAAVLAVLAERPSEPPATPRLLYTGGLNMERGALTYADLARTMDDAFVQAVGVTPVDLARKMQERAGSGASRLEIVGIGEKLPFSRILQAYREPWTCGLAVMPETSHYREKELTKFFEYMAAGLPILASDFPVWKSLIEGHRVGLCVDPNSLEAVQDAVRWLAAHPDEARAMGERGRAAVLSTFNWDKEAARLIGLMRELLGERQP